MPTKGEGGGESESEIPKNREANTSDLEVTVCYSGNGKASSTCSPRAGLISSCPAASLLN
jgi:hypothetical protein